MKMGTNIGQVMTLANSIIGVSVLAMPYCFKQCGILLSIILLCVSSYLSRFACRFLLQAAILTRRRNYEFLAFHVFGPSGKLCVELSIIGFLFGTCIAFFVVLGDLGPAISSSMFGLHHSDTLRSTILIGVALVVVLPLGLLRNVDSLSSLCTATIAFYLCLVLKVLGEAAVPLMLGDWVSQLNFWRPAGVLQCLPIFSMALFCQTQLFEIFDSVPNAALDRMDAVVRVAVNMCTTMYISVGFFGYVAFSKENISGNILVSLSESVSSEVIKLGFFLSVAASFPLVIFPCRRSLYSLLYRNAQPPMHDIVATHVPEGRFKLLTLGIVGFSLTVGLFLPNIEQVLGIIGSTIGVTICIIIPALLLMNTARHPKDKLSSQIILWTGAVIMILGTYAHILHSDQAVRGEQDISGVADNLMSHDIDHLNERPIESAILESAAKFEEQVMGLSDQGNLKNEKKVEENIKLPSVESVMEEKLNEKTDRKQSPASSNFEEKRMEPPVPIDAAEKLADLPVPIENIKKDSEKLGNKNTGEKRHEPPIPVEGGWEKQRDKPPEPTKLKSLGPSDGKKKDFRGTGKKDKLFFVHKGSKPIASVVLAPESNIREGGVVETGKRKKTENREKIMKVVDNEVVLAGEQVNQDAIRHEEAELALEGKKLDTVNHEKVNEVNQEKKSEEQDLLKTLKEHQEVQRDMLHEQQQILLELKKHELGHQVPTKDESPQKSVEIADLNMNSMKMVNNAPPKIQKISANSTNKKEKQKLSNDYKQQYNLAPAIDNQLNKTIIKPNSLSGDDVPLRKQNLDQTFKGSDKLIENRNGASKSNVKMPAIMPLPLAYKVSSQPPPKLPPGRDILESQHHVEKRDTEINSEQGAGLGPLIVDQHALENQLVESKEKECSREPAEIHHQTKHKIGHTETEKQTAAVKNLSPIESENFQSGLTKAESEVNPSSFVRTLSENSKEHVHTKSGNLNPIPRDNAPQVAMELKTPSSISEPQLVIHQHLEQVVDSIGVASGVVPAPTKIVGHNPVEENH